MPGSGLGGLVDRLLRREAVRCEQLDVAVVRAEHGDLVLDHLGAVLVDQAAEEDRVGVGAADLPEERLVARRLRIPGLEAGDLDPDGLRGVPEVRRDAEAVGLLVVQDVDARDALLLGELGHGRALVRVMRDDAGVVAAARGVVLVRLGRVATGPALGEADVRVRGRDHRDAAARSLVQHRDLDRGAARVERADDADDLLVAGIGLRVRRALARVPLARLSGRVVARLVGDVVVAGLEVRLLEEVADRLHDLDRLRTRRALEREVGRDQNVRLAFAFVLDRRARARRQRLDAARATRGLGGRTVPALFVVAAATRRNEREHRDEQGQNAQPSTSTGIQLLSSSVTLMACPTRFGRVQLRPPERANGAVSWQVAPHFNFVTPDYTLRQGRSGGTGRRAGLKIRFPSGSVGSIPTFGIDGSLVRALPGVRARRLRRRCGAAGAGRHTGVREHAESGARPRATGCSSTGRARASPGGRRRAPGASSCRPTAR